LKKNIWDTVDSLSGWLSFSAATISQALVEKQSEMDVRGSYIELGVYKGKFLSLLNHWATIDSSKVIGIDGFFAGFGLLLEDQFIELAKNEMIMSVSKVNSNISNLEIIKIDTHDLKKDRLLEALGSQIRFASIDAGHERDDIINDIGLIAELLHPGGLIAIDDVFNPIVPGVTEGLCYFLETNSSIKPFAYAGNKLFVCRSESHQKYYNSSLDILMNGTGDFFDTSRKNHESNCAINYSPKFSGANYIAFC